MNSQVKGSFVLFAIIFALSSLGFAQDGLFYQANTYQTGRTPFGITAADFNADGLNDLATADAAGTMTVLLNQGNAIFSAMVSDSLGGYPNAICAGDIDSDSDIDVVVTNHETSVISIFKNYGTGTFEPAIAYPVGADPWSIFAADFDNDSDLDLATADEGIGELTVLLNSGNGSFPTSTNYASDSGAFSVYGGDFDGDSDVDLVVANLFFNNIYVYLNDGSGAFSQTHIYSTGNGAIAVFVANVIGSSAKDILVLNHYDNNLSIFENDGSANFSFVANYGTMELPRSLYVAQIDSDGVADILVANETGGYMSFLKGNGDGTFQPMVNFLTNGSGPISVVASDFNADQKLDAAVANIYSSTVSIFINSGGSIGTGWMSGVVTDSTTAAPLAGVIVTVLGAGIVDTTDLTGNYFIGPITSNIYDIEFALLPYVSKIISDVFIAVNDTTILDVAMNRQGWLDGEVVDSITRQPISGAIVEIVGSGSGDITDITGYYLIGGLQAGEYSVEFSHPAYDTKTIPGVTINLDDTTHLDVEMSHYEAPRLFAPAVLYGSGSTPFGITAADFNGDTYADLATADAVGTMTVLLNTGDGTFYSGVTYPAGGYPTAICSGDIDNDGDIDAMVASHSSADISVFRNNGDGTFAPRSVYLVSDGPWSIYADDFNGDSYLDLVTANESANNIGVLLNNGDGSFAEQISYVAGTGPFSVYGGDFDDDGDIDLVAANLGSDNIYLYLNDGAGNFSFSNSYESGDGAVAVYVADVIGTSTPDIVVANHYANNVTVFENTGNGNFSFSNSYATQVFPRSLCVAPIDYDGINDIVVADERSAAISFHKGVGDGTFEDMDNYLTFGTSPVSVVSADFNNDWKLDVAAVNANSDVISVFINVGQSPSPGWVSGTVTDSISLEPISGAIVRAVGTLVIDTTDISGNYFIEEIPSGPRDFRFEHPDYSTRTRRGFAVAPNDTSILDVTMTRYGWINGVVIDSMTEQPLLGVTVSVIGTNISDVTDSAGYYLLGGLSHGDYAVSFSHPDYAPKYLEDVAVISGDTLILNIGLGPMGYIIGEVMDTSGFSLSGVLVRAIPSNISTHTNVSGYYILDDLAGGTYDLQFSLEGYITLTIPDISVIPTETTIVNAELILSPAEVIIWYGNPSREPITAQIGDYVTVDVYAQTRDYVHIANLHLCLGVMNDYVDSLCSREMGAFYPPLTQWDEASFLYQNSSPPNQPGWSSQSFLGFASLNSTPNPYLHCETPTRIMTMVIHVVNDSSLIGDTIVCIGEGVHSPLGYSAAGDSMGGPGFSLAEYFSPLVFVSGGSPCNYIIGDINGDSLVNGSDVTFAVRYFKGLGISPHDSCSHDSLEGNEYLYPAGDVNGNCEFRGSDVTKLVAFFKGLTTLSYCRFFPPFRMNRRSD